MFHPHSMQANLSLIICSNPPLPKYQYKYGKRYSFAQLLFWLGDLNQSRKGKEISIRGGLFGLFWLAYSVHNEAREIPSKECINTLFISISLSTCKVSLPAALEWTLIGRSYFFANLHCSFNTRICNCFTFYSQIILWKQKYIWIITNIISRKVQSNLTNSHNFIVILINQLNHPGQLLFRSLAWMQSYADLDHWIFMM